jgi:putative membrane protein insertion efficiency factor
MKHLLLAVLRLYRRALSPVIGPCCRFEPSCSAYAEEALHAHGVLRGLALTAWRLLRCQPFARAGLDPVPPRAGAL